MENLDKLGYRGVSVAYVFDEHHEASGELLGGGDGAGQGPRQMLDALDVGRVGCGPGSASWRGTSSQTTEARGGGSLWWGRGTSYRAGEAGRGLARTVAPSAKR